MAFEGASKVWINGRLVPWQEATIHVCSHVVHYGSSVFEGARCYKTTRGAAIFRHREHVRRLLDSAKIYRMEPSYSEQQLSEAVIETIRANQLEACYIRPVIYRGFGTLGVNPSASPIDTAIAVWKWGAYLGAEALEQGVDVTVSTWSRMAPNTFPAMAKSGANYMNAQLINVEARERGFIEGIALSTEGYVSEGSGENVFVWWRGKLLTPPVSASILPGITRDTVITLARELGYTVDETNIPREMLYVADEVFFTGSAAEVTPIRSIDRVKIGEGRRGEVTEKIQRAFFAVVNGEDDNHQDWLTPVYS
ncbi:MAG: branched-chain amino acid transaminase [Acidobacteriota bacterium]|nr:MAG: branched-chain amino acid transaminase [Acidobacteriota bacterium]